MLWGDWRVCTFESLWLFFGKEVVFSKITLSLFTLKEGSTFHLGLLPLREEEGNRPTWYSEPLRYNVGGPIKGFRHDYAVWDRCVLVGCASKDSAVL